MPSPRPNFSEWITSTGSALGYTNSASLARALNIQQSTISRWKTKNSQPSVEHLSRISQLFGVDLKVLLVLAGYIEAVPPSPDELRAAPRRTRAEEMIGEADLDPHLEEFVREYWSARMEEEHARLAGMIDFAKEAASKGLSRPMSKTALRMHTLTNIMEHFSDFQGKLSDYLLHEGVVVDFERGERVEDTRWFAPPGETRKPLPSGTLTHVSHWGAPGEVTDPQAPRWRAVLTGSDRVAMFWTEPMRIADIPEALNEIRLVNGLANERHDVAPEEEDES